MYKIQIPITCTWQTLRDKFRDIGEVKFAEIRGNDVGVVRFFKEKDAELAISKYFLFQNFIFLKLIIIFFCRINGWV